MSTSMEPKKQFIVDGIDDEEEEVSKFHQAGIHPSTLEFNFVLQPIIQPSPVQDVISILEKHLADQDRNLEEHAKVAEKIKSLGEPNKDEGVKKEDGVFSGSKLDGERTSDSEKSDVNSNLKYVVVDQNGAPDWTKVLNLDKNIIKEVCKKHGINIDALLSGKRDGKNNKELKEKKTKSSKKKKKSKPENPDKTVPCSLCDKTFQTKRHLQNHMIYHGTKYKCTKCDFTTVRVKELEYHQHAHTGERPFVCDICGKSFRHPAVLSVHKKTHRGHTGAVSCSECKMEFDQPHQLDRHMQTHSEERPHQCGFCKNNFKRAMDLRKHIILYHNEVAASVDQIVPAKKSTTPQEGDFKCNQCSRSFQTAFGLQLHKRRMHRRTGGYEDGDEMKFTCQQCKKVCSSLRVLKKHKNTHSTLRPYTCSICGRSFKHQWERHKHKQTHSEQPVVPCTKCDAKFKSRFNLNRHIKRMHTEGKRTTPKPHQCDICQRAYARKTELEEHMNVHTGEKPFVCDTCGKTFSFRSSLACHKKLHKEEAAILCDICGKRFGSKIRMREHRVVHTGEKPFACDHCGTSYKYPSNLRWHLNKAHKMGPCGGNRRQQKSALDQSVVANQPATAEVEHVLTPLDLATIQYQSETNQVAQLHQEDNSEQPVMQIHYDTGEVHKLITAPVQYASTVQPLPKIQIENVATQQVLGQEDLMTVAEFVLQASDGSRVLQAADGTLFIETPVDQLETSLNAIETNTTLNQGEESATE